MTTATTGTPVPKPPGLGDAKEELEIAEKAILWTAIQENISSVFNVEKKLQEELQEFKKQVQVNTEKEIKKQAVETVEAKKKEATELAKEYQGAKDKASKIKFISWNVLSFNLVVDVPDTTDKECTRPIEAKEGEDIYSCRNLGNPFPLYKSNLEVGEEKRMSALRNWLMKTTIKTAGTELDLPDFICLQQVTRDFLQFYTTQGAKTNTYNLVWDSPFIGIYAKDRVHNPSKLYFAGQQGIFLLFNTQRWTSETFGIYGTPFAYFFGTGDVQLFCQFERIADKAKLLVASMNIYPLSWSLLYGPTKVSATTEEPEVTLSPLTTPSTKPTDKKTIIAVTFRKPIILKILKEGIPTQLLTGKFNAKEMAFKWFPSISLGEEKKLQYNEEEKPCELKNLCNPEVERYPTNTIDRYRFFLYTGDPENNINKRFDSLTYQYLLQTIFKEGSKIRPLIDGALWSFDPTKHLLLLVDVIYIAETQCLFFNERLNFYAKPSALATPPPSVPSTTPVATAPKTAPKTAQPPGREILAAVSFSYDVTRTRLLNFSAGKMAPWIKHVKDLSLTSTQPILTTETPPTRPAPDTCTQEGIEMKSAFQAKYTSGNSLTWWVPQYIEQCNKKARLAAATAAKIPPGTAAPGAVPAAGGPISAEPVATEVSTDVPPMDAPPMEAPPEDAPPIDLDAPPPS